jgi:hypothetical protein
MWLAHHIPKPLKRLHQHMNPQIYFLTPCLNSAATIDKTIWGIASQEGGCVIRYHVQDGGSTDGTLERLEHWKKRFESLRGQLPSRIDFSFSTQRDGGMYEGIRNGFAHMRIPDDALMGWCNADDVIWQGCLAHIIRVGREFPEAQWLTGWSTAFDELGRFCWTDRHTFFPRQILAAGLANGRHWPHLQQESTFWRKRLWDKVGGVDPTFKLAGDWDLWRRFAKHEELVHVDRQLGAFYFRKGQKSSDAARYSGECEACRPMATRMSEFRRLLSTHPILGVTRIKADENDVLRRHDDALSSLIPDKVRATLMPPSYYFRRLRRRHRAQSKKRS